MISGQYKFARKTWKDNCNTTIEIFDYFFICPSRDGPYYVIHWLGMAGGRPRRFPHNNFSSEYRIFTKLGHMILLWKGKNLIYFGVIKSTVKVTVTINIIFLQQGRFRTITLVLYIGSSTNLATWFTCGRGRTLIILRSLSQRSRSPLL